MTCSNFFSSPVRSIRDFVIACLSVWLVGCVNLSEAPDEDPFTAIQNKGYEVGQSVPRINNFRISSWIYVNQKSALISTSPRRQYLVIFTHMCRNLNQASTLATRSVTGPLSRLDFVYIIDGSIGDSIHRKRCAVDEIYEITKSMT